MVIELNSNSFFVFDLDDTLYPEIDYLKSAYKNIAGKVEKVSGKYIYNEMLERYFLKENVFKWIESSYAHLDPDLSIPNLLQLYRDHLPEITLNEKTKSFLDSLKAKNIPLGLITDGRSNTQRNKLKALGIENYFDDIIISQEFGSEKPDERNYLYFENKYRGKKFYFIGDNTSKDFIVPLKLGWVSICLRDNGRNIHSQNLEDNIFHGSIINLLEDLVLL